MLKFLLKYINTAIDHPGNDILEQSRDHPNRNRLTQAQMWSRKAIKA